MGVGYEKLSGSDPDERPTVSHSISPDRIILQKQGRPSNGAVIVLHYLFKMMAITLYMFGWLVTSSYIMNFIIITLLLSIDFWIVKNISGRLLAGLRWWSVVDDEGKLTWQYECWSAEERDLAKSRDNTLFWAGLIGAQLTWIVYATISLFSLHLSWFLLCSVALSLNSANLFGSIRCRVGKMNLRQKFTDFVLRAVLRRPQTQTQQNI